MTEVNFGADLQAAEQKYNIGVGSGKFKIKEGENRVRILSRGVALQSTYTNLTTGLTAKLLPFRGDESIIFFITPVAQAATKVSSTTCSLCEPYCRAITTISVGAFKFPENGDPLTGDTMPVAAFTE